MRYGGLYDDYGRMHNTNYVPSGLMRNLHERMEETLFQLFYLWVVNYGKLASPLNYSHSVRHSEAIHKFVIAGDRFQFFLVS